jgi:dihydrolipoamide dehydrogenase
MVEKFDAVVIGAGPAGYTSALRLGRFGKKVLVIDRTRSHAGGVCLNEGCIPTKALLFHSHLHSQIQKSADHGIHSLITNVDIKKIRDNINNAKTQLRDGIFTLFKKNGVSFHEGEGTVLDKGRVRLDSPSGTREISCDNIIISTGSQPQEIRELPFDGKTVLSSAQALCLEELPKSIAIIGGGSIGIEFAEIFRGFGSDVTIIEMEKSLLPREDEELGRHMAAYLKKKGVAVLTESVMAKAEKAGDALDLTVRMPSGETKLKAGAVLVAIGRKPHIGNIVLRELYSLEKDFIPADAKTKKISHGLYAAGDVTPGPMLAHRAYHDGELAAHDIAGQKMEAEDMKWIPRITYSRAQAAGIGLTEKEAEEKGISIIKSKYYFKGIGMAVASGEDTGFIKILADAKSKALVGAHILGPEAGEIIHILYTAYKGGITADRLKHFVFGHPTYSEIIREAAEGL